MGSMAARDRGLRDSLAGHSTDHLLGILATQDEDEWRAEVFPLVREILAERGVDAQKVRAMTPRAAEPMADLVVLEAFFNPIDAQIVKAALQASAIPVQLLDEQVCSLHLGLSIPVGGVKLAVPRCCEEEARAIAAAAASGELAESVPLDCPSCGLTGAGSARRLGLYRCAACGHAWA
jgi:hypothetical protein